MSPNDRYEEVDCDKYYTNLLGTGAINSGSIKLVKQNGIIYVKKTKIRPNEYNILKFLGCGETHKNIISVVDLYETENEYNLIMLLYKRDLFDALIKNELPKSEIECLYDLLEGLEFLHNHNIAHRDIKPENIFIKYEEKSLCYGDFGLSLKCDGNNNYSSDHCGTLLYSPPEYTTSERWNVFPADIWSLGITFYTIIFKKFPIRTQNGLIVKLPHMNDTNLKEVFLNMLVEIPEYRKTPKELMSMEYFINL